MQFHEAGEHPHTSGRGVSTTPGMCMQVVAEGTADLGFAMHYALLVFLHAAWSAC